MKKLLIPVVVFIALSFTANAQNKMHKKGHRQHHHKGMMSKQLNFSEEQKAKAKTINTDYRKKMQELNKQENITVKEMRTRRAAIQKDKQAAMNELLTSEQKTRMQQIKAEQKVKREEAYARKMEKMKTNLDLSDEQVSQLQAKRSSTQAKAQKIKNNEALSPQQKKEQMMALKAEAREQHQKILTPEQIKKKEEMKKMHQKRDLRQESKK